MAMLYIIVAVVDGERRETSFWSYKKAQAFLEAQPPEFQADMVYAINDFDVVEEEDEEDAKE